ncbi:MAG: M23 family metallopeptidase [Clostridia bacterium]|nr:M23 family metallopeptidase [Clostridia bacterium]
MKITYTNTPVNRQKKGNYPSFKAIMAMACVIALMTAVKVIYSPEESLEDVAAMANATITEETEEETQQKENTKAIQTSVLHLSSFSYQKNSNKKQSFFPLKGKITSYFERRTDPFEKEKSEMHLGIDITPESTRNIIAYSEGTVTKASYHPSYGNYIKLRHSPSLETLYAHCSVLKVKEGDKIMGGQVIAVTGSTGRSTGEHLHFEVRENGVCVDPQKYIS